MIQRPPISPLFPYTTLFRSIIELPWSSGNGVQELQICLVRLLSDQIENKIQGTTWVDRSEEHTSELQSRGHLVCRLLLETKNGPSVLSRSDDIVSDDVVAGR